MEAQVCYVGRWLATDWDLGGEGEFMSHTCYRRLPATTPAATRHCSAMHGGYSRETHRHVRLAVAGRAWE